MSAASPVGADCVWTKRECRKRACGQAGDNALGRVAPNLPTLIHPLPTLRRTGPAAGRRRLRRNNNRFLISISGRTLSWRRGPPQLGQRQTAAITTGTIA